MSTFRYFAVAVVLGFCLLSLAGVGDAGAGEQAAQSTTITIAPSDDAFVYSRFPDNNYGGRTTLQIGGIEPLYPAPLARAYLKFDLSALPPDITIVSARIYLRTQAISGEPPFVIARQVQAHYETTDAWTEGSLTWNNKPAYTGPARGTQWVTAADTWYSWGVGPDVLDALTGDQVFTAVFRQTYEDEKWVNFWSKDNTTSPTYDPYLEIVYEFCPPPPVPPSTPPLTLYFHDTGVMPHWGQTYVPEFWEPMDPDSTTFSRPSFGQDLDLDNPFYVVSGQVTGDYSAHYRANIWMANNNPGSNYVEAELRYGNCPNDGALLATDGVWVTNTRPAQMYMFDFGNIEGLNLNNEALIVKIIYHGPTPWDCHIYWDHSAKPSALYTYTAPRDTVVCEESGGANPAHPPTYWYDVTPGDFGRCDFHVRVYDPNPANYTNPTLPGPAWQFQVHQVGDEWWASWWNPDCTEAIFSTFRFQFDHADECEWKVWGDWTTTISGTSNPHAGVVDSSGTHSGEPDGYGYRVHVPSEPAVGVEKEVAAKHLQLAQNVPNPFNPWTQISYTIPETQGTVRVMLDVYDVSGRLVNTLVNEMHGSGIFAARWDGTDFRGASVASGVYFCRLAWNGEARTIRMVLLR